MLKKIITGLSILGMFFGLSCGERPAKRVDISDLAKNEGKRVSVSGMPSQISYRGFWLKDGNDSVYVARAYETGGRLEIDVVYEKAKRALEKEAQDGDNEEVIVFGKYKSDILSGKSVTIDGNRYSIVRR